MFRKSKSTIRIVLVVGALSVLPALTGMAQECGNVNADPGGLVDLADITLLSNHLFIDFAPLPNPADADMDKVPGVTTLDLHVLIDHIFGSLAPLDCNVIPDTTFPPGPDVIEFRNRVVPAGVTDWMVEVWMHSPEPYLGLTLPFEYFSADPSITLDTIVIAPEPVVYGRGYVHQSLPRGMITYSKGGEDEYPPGEHLVATLFFSCDPSMTSTEIGFVPAGFPPTDHELVVMRTGGPRVVMGTVPGLQLDLCWATGDVNGSGTLDITDMTALVNILCVSHDIPPDIYIADVTGDCVVDTLDAYAIACVIFGPCADTPVLPVETCCDPEVVFCGASDTTVGLGGSEVTVDTTGGDTTYVAQVDATGKQGIRYYPSNPGASRGVSMDLTNADMTVDGANITLTAHAMMIDNFTREEELGLVGLCGITNPIGLDARLQVIADFNAIGDPDVFVQAFDGDQLSGQTTVAGGGLIAYVGDNIHGYPWIDRMELHATEPPAFIIYLDQFARIELYTGAVLFGDNIRLIAENATKTLEGVYESNATAGYMGWFGTGYTSNVCCRGYKGNVDADVTDGVTLGDLTVLVDHLFISLDPLYCPEEADIDLQQDGNVTLGDLTVMVDHLFISL
ncbi:hypothetical protein GF377_07135, partial [candidate division GN15 bacterium]|nr:hypothetical protein [candidate division GN15 bacterium]